MLVEVGPEESVSRKIHAVEEAGLSDDGQAISCDHLASADWQANLQTQLGT